MIGAAPDLQRFVDAQAPVFEAVCAELRAGRKRTHWMWYVFPQLAALGRSQTTKYYGLDSIDDARAYLVHPLLGPRLIACARLLLPHRGRSLTEILGTPDDLKFVSCMTLFDAAGTGEPVFRECLDLYCDGRRDAATLSLLRAG